MLMDWTLNVTQHFIYIIVSVITKLDKMNRALFLYYLYTVWFVFKLILFIDVLPSYTLSIHFCKIVNVTWLISLADCQQHDGMFMPIYFKICQVVCREKRTAFYGVSWTYFFLAVFLKNKSEFNCIINSIKLDMNDQTPAITTITP